MTRLFNFKSLWARPHFGLTKDLFVRFLTKSAHILSNSHAFGKEWQCSTHLGQNTYILATIGLFLNALVY